MTWEPTQDSKAPLAEKIERLLTALKAQVADDKRKLENLRTLKERE